MDEVLRTIKIIQEREVKDGFGLPYTEERLNPYNPLTYIFIVIMVLLSLVLYGLVGTYEELHTNPFKWS